MTRSKRSFRGYLRALLLVDESPERTAFAYALGVFFGFCPLVGIHTILALAVGFLFRLNRVAILVGVYSNTPWTYPVMLALGTGVGIWLLGWDAEVPEISADLLVSLPALRALWEDLQGLLVPFLLGNFALAAALAVPAYFVSRTLIRRYRTTRSGSER